jgi:hypothetical protein
VARVLADARRRAGRRGTRRTGPRAGPGCSAIRPRGSRRWAAGAAFGGVTAAGLVGLAVGFWSPEAVDALSGGQFWSLSGGNGWSPDLSELALEAAMSETPRTPPPARPKRRPGAASRSRWRSRWR